jgi:hypothetical protein
MPEILVILLVVLKAVRDAVQALVPFLPEVIQQVLIILILQPKVTPQPLAISQPLLHI